MCIPITVLAYLLALLGFLLWSGNDECMREWPRKGGGYSETLTLTKLDVATEKRRYAARIRAELAELEREGIR